MANAHSLAFIAALGLFASRSAVASAELPQPVADWLAQAKSDCPGGFADHGAVKEVDLTGDGRPAYVADPHALSCAGSPHMFGGSAPASIELFVTGPSGNVVHTGGVLALGYRIDPTPGGPPTIIFDTHDTKDEAGSFDAYRWDGHNFQMIHHTSMAAPPVQ
ncbi:MAG TPA: hypothetical protein VKZ79_03200 [Alphaproteobacteria bacterium]|nr:hypothetical protein [Alphaproteobacteria bacterium]